MIRLLVLDVDGCLTDGKIIYSSDGVETKAFNVKDGLAIASWIKLGHEVAIITGRESEIVKRRAKELGITHLHQGIGDKASLLKQIAKERGFAHSELAAIGDDLNDYEMLQLVGRSFTPADGAAVIQKSVDTVLQKRGGDGAVREMIEQILEENGETEQFLSLWIKE